MFCNVNKYVCTYKYVFLSSYFAYMEDDNSNKT
jgi:hypothetical protein